ncbi:MAG: hypothetical protein IKF78_03245 [Atopobiaceae bacterium]|nr:hypothetical protein [Atopobiaceae bacterium]
MATNKQLFTQESLERMQSPEKVDEYIRVSRPSVWVLVAALVLIVCGALVWGFTGSIAKTQSTKGVMYEEDANHILCLLPLEVGGQYLVGHEANIALASGQSIQGTVIAVGEDPMSFEEVQKQTRSDWRFQTLWGDTQDLYQYAITIGYEGDAQNAYGLQPRELVDVSVVLTDVAPITYVLN